MEGTPGSCSVFGSGGPQVLGRQDDGKSECFQEAAGNPIQSRSVVTVHLKEVGLGSQPSLSLGPKTHIRKAALGAQLALFTQTV